MRQCAGVTEGVEMDYRYGSGPDQVDEFFRTKRSWSKVKDEILGHYIDCYLKTVQHLQRRIIIAAGFAGPGVFGDDTPASPLIICNSTTTNPPAQAAIACPLPTAHPSPPPLLA